MMDEKLIDHILKTVELEIGINRLDFTSNSRKEVYLGARKKATKLLIEEAQLSDEGIGKILGVSKSTANTYRISLGYRRRY
jgi:chromosomal replication initiation ATPase DnaA